MFVFSVIVVVVAVVVKATTAPLFIVVWSVVRFDVLGVGFWLKPDFWGYGNWVSLYVPPNGGSILVV